MIEPTIRQLARAVLVACLGALLVVNLRAQEAAPAPSPAPAAQPEARTTGLPHGLDWTFNLDASWGNFGFANSLYADPKPEQPSGDLGDNWFEGAAKPAITGTFTSAKSWQLSGKISVVGARTYGAAPTLVGEDASSFKVEDLSLEWKSGKAIGGGENVLQLAVGRTQYGLGHGLLLWDGAADGGNRGGYWTNARKAFEFAAIGRFKPGHHTLESFYLDKDDLPGSDSGTRLWGTNYEYALGEHTTLGGTYLRFYADREQKPQRDRLNVYNARLFTAPFPSLRGLSFEAEYAKEDNGEVFDSYAWNGLAAYEFSNSWKPKLSYRYAYFQGDDPTTLKSEAFDGLLTGFYDWGTWWQGEIAGEYFVSNSNLISHQVRVHVSPNEAIGTGLTFYKFLADKPGAVGPQVTSKDVAMELDWYMDWKVNGNFSFSFVGAFANPGKLVEQVYDRRKNFAYGMLYLGYSY